LKSSLEQNKWLTKKHRPESQLKKEIVN